MTETNQIDETLNETLRRRAAEWTPENISEIIAGLRTQRERWNINQQTGSRKLVKSSSIKTKKLPPAKLFDLLI